MTFCSPLRIAAGVTFALLLPPGTAQAFDLQSPDIRDSGTIEITQVNSDMGCSGRNLSPALVWNDPPEGTQSFAITVYDPDAPTGSGWWHWIVFDIPGDSRGIPAGASGDLAPPAVESLTDFGQPGYGGPCPPTGAAPHRYQIRLHALDIARLGLDGSAMPALAGYMINAHSLGTVGITGLYGR